MIFQEYELSDFELYDPISPDDTKAWPSALTQDLWVPDQQNDDDDDEKDGVDDDDDDDDKFSICWYDQ